MIDITHKKNKIISTLKDFIFIFFIVFFVSYGFVSVFWKNNIVNIFGFEFSIIKSNSMSQSIEKYDFVVVKKHTNNYINIGDIVVFFDSTNQHKIIHRVVNIKTNSQNQTMLQTKGDNNPYPDIIWQNTSNIYALYAFKVPYLGFIVSYFSTYLGVFNIVIWLIVFVFLDVVWKEESITLDQDFKKPQKTLKQLKQQKRKNSTTR